MSEIKQNIVLNFLPLSEQEFLFTVYRRLVEHQEKKWSDNIRRYNLPRNQGESENFTSCATNTSYWRNAGLSAKLKVFASYIRQKLFAFVFY